MLHLHIWILFFSSNFSYLTNVIFTAVCWLFLWYDYLYQFRRLKILSQLWLQIVLWKQSYSTIRSTQINLYQQFAVICRKFWIKKKNLSGQYSYLPTPSSQVLQCPCCPLQRVWIWALRKKCEVGFDYWRVPQHLDSFGWFCTVWERSYAIPLWENKSQIVSKKQWHTWELSQLKL